LCSRTDPCSIADRRGFIDEKKESTTKKEKKRAHRNGTEPKGRGERKSTQHRRGSTKKRLGEGKKKKTSLQGTLGQSKRADIGNRVEE